MQHNYFVYILTNKSKTVLYTGVTNDLKERIVKHEKGINKGSFTSKYNCYYLVYMMRFQYIEHAITYEKKIKGWSRQKKEDLINEFNPKWDFINNKINDI